MQLALPGARPQPGAGDPEERFDPPASYETNSIECHRIPLVDAPPQDILPVFADAQPEASQRHLEIRLGDGYEDEVAKRRISRDNVGVSFAKPTDIRTARLELPPRRLSKKEICFSLPQLDRTALPVRPRGLRFKRGEY